MVKISELFTRWLAARLNVPRDALRMFSAANRLSGLSRRTLPSELIPLNSTQIARGVLNFTVFQSLNDWVMPFWAECQYDVRSRSFIPRSHLGLSMNVTQRNWTAVGVPGCAVEPVVDPRGLLTPLRHSWSLDTWLVADGETVFPSRVRSVKQRLRKNLPIVETSLEHRDLRLAWVCYTVGQNVHHDLTLVNRSTRLRRCRVVLAIRPYNPEGVSLVERISYDSASLTVTVNSADRLLLDEPPDSIVFSGHTDGDSARAIKGSLTGLQDSTIHCPMGLANCAIVYEVSLKPGSRWTNRCSVPLEFAATSADNHQASGPDDAVKSWCGWLASGATVDVPDLSLNAAGSMAAATLLMLTDSSSITPGPFTYHQFWFRDAAYMILALDRLGHASSTRPVVMGFSEKQDSSGYYRSQQGEWDSTGQALWSTWQHSLLSRDLLLLEKEFRSLREGAKWIQRNRLTQLRERAQPYAGLLPAGLSAEHLGLADHYFWDNFWSLAGLDAFSRICGVLGRKAELNEVGELIRDYRADIERAVSRAQTRNGSRAIPAAPGRDLDFGMIGSVAAAYPLQLLGPDDPTVSETLLTIEGRFFKDGMFYQQFVHSGLNAYLTLQVAHAWLFAGARERFWKMLKKVLSHASPTLCFPEAIHPLTGGGSMGDGHHGWAAAEIVLALRDAFVWEEWHADRVSPVLHLLSGIPTSWFAGDVEFGCRNLPLPDGSMSMAARRAGRRLVLRFEFGDSGLVPASSRILHLPFLARDVLFNGRALRPLRQDGHETRVELPMDSRELEITLSRSRQW